MQDQETAYEPMQESHTLRNVLFAVAILFVIGSSILMYSLYSRLGALELAQKQAADDAAAHNEAIMKKLGITQANVEAEAKALAAKGVQCSELHEERWGSITWITLPGGGKVGLYQPKHPLAFARASN